MFRTIHPALFALGASLFPASGEIHAAAQKPNIVFVLADDLGYADIGKWHLGQLPAVMPTAQGFDSYYGRPGPNHGRSDVYRNTTLIKKNDPADYPNITREYTEEALSFFRQHDPAVTGKPFFLYLAHSMPHIPLAVSEKFKGSSNAGLYGDVIQELDWSIGELLKWLETSGQLKNTIFIFTSDNGPSGVAAPPLHGGKGSTWEGGFRVPMIIRWDGNIPAGRMCKETATMMDFLPTLAAVLHLPLPKDVKRDGHNIWALMTQEGARTPYKELYYYGRDGKLAAVRSGNLKVHMLEPSERWAGRLVKRAGRFDENLSKEIRKAYTEQ